MNGLALVRAHILASWHACHLEVLPPEQVVFVVVEKGTTLIRIQVAAAVSGARQRTEERGRLRRLHLRLLAARGVGAALVLLLPVVLLLTQLQDPLLQLVLLDLHHEVGLLQVAGQVPELFIVQRLVVLSQRQKALPRQVILLVARVRLLRLSRLVGLRGLGHVHL